MGTFKEMFHQSADSGIPSHWVVFYWPEGISPCSRQHNAEYFATEDEAIKFVGSLNKSG